MAGPASNSVSVPRWKLEGSPPRPRRRTISPARRVVVRQEEERLVAPFDSDDLTSAIREADQHLQVVTQASTSDLVDGDWIARSSREGLNARELYSWPFEVPDFDGGVLCAHLERCAELISTARYRRSGKTEVVARLDGALINLTFMPPQKMWMGVAARTRKEASAVVDLVLEMFPERRSGSEEAPSIPLSVWTQAHAEPTRRTTEVSAWRDIASNYPSKTRDQLSALMDPHFEAGKGGKLILLHGMPGTGKSTALATLAWEWRNWCELHYIADPADFLSAPEYFVHVALGRRREEDWRVVLLEDAGGLFAPDAKQMSGEDRLGRLLNVTDGLLGNTSKSLFIITTNEPLSSFHAAVSRPGRCSATVEFLPLSEAEAKDWLRAHGRSELIGGVAGERTLAELFSLMDGVSPRQRSSNPVGFQTGGTNLPERD